MRYKITYTRNGKEITAHRNAEKAADALEVICNQYLWGFRLKMISADDGGLEWTTALADTNGGINYNLYMEAIMEGK